MVALLSADEGGRPARIWQKRMIQGLLLVLALLVTAAVGEWAARREIDRQSDAIHRTLDLQVSALRGKVGQYANIPYTAAQHSDVQALLLQPSPERIQRVNVYLQEVSRRIGADALYLMDGAGLTLAASNWNSTASLLARNMISARISKMQLPAPMVSSMPLGPLQNPGSLYQHR